MSIKEQLNGMKYFFVIIGLIIICAVGGKLLYPYAPWVFDDNTNPYRDDYVPPGQPEHGKGFYITMDGKIAPTTQLSKEEMKIQEEQGCLASSCHKK